MKSRGPRDRIAKKPKIQVRKIAKKYISCGWRVVPVPRKKKAPVIKGWQKLRIKKSEIPEYIDARDNIGILLGKPSGGLVDIDLDCEHAIFLAPYFLPKTDRIHGRKTKPNSHYWFRCAPTPTPEKFCDIDNSSLLEIRSTGQQTIVPPSVHPSGERVRWSAKGRPGDVRETTLVSATKKLAAATIIARHWPNKGSRNDAGLALAGMLLQAGWDDADVEGFISSVAQAAGDEESKARKRGARATRERIDKGGTFTGRPKLEKLLGATVVERACEWLGIGRLTVPSVDIRSVEADWPKPLSKRAYCGLAGEIVRALAPITEADKAGLLVQFLVCFGNTIDRNPHFRIGAAEHHSNLFCVLVGRTAKARKGTSWAEIRQFFENADHGWAARCVQPGGLASGEGLVWAVRDPIEKKVKPKRVSGQDQDITTTVDDGVGDKRLLVIETEFASPLRVMRREGSILSATVRSAWDKGDLANLTKQLPARATGAHISIIGHITREELLREFSATEGHNGFANRFLWVCVRRTKFLPLGGQLKDKPFRALVGRLQGALARARKKGELKFTKQAKRLWCKVYRELGHDFPGLLGTITSRSEPQVLRLSMLYALLDCSTFLRRKHLRAALAVWRYCEDSARYIFGDSFGDFVVDAIFRRLRKSAEGLTRTEIREIFSRNRTESEISNALRVLKENGLATFVREETAGRPSERWFAVR
jgi:hypothetical protein